MWRWLLPGLGIKRYVALVGLGLGLLGFGVGVGVVAPHFGDPSRAARINLVVGTWAVGLVAVGAGGWLGIRTLARALNLPEPVLAELFASRQRAARGPRVVALGGGTGLPALLRGLKAYTSNITAIVTVADDGGSSGRLRGALGMLPPGDIRNCLVALADTEPLMRDLFQYRFRQGELAGHSFGNLFLAAMEQTTGDFVTALKESSRVLAVRGAVLPATLDRVELVAELEDGRLLRGESQIGRSPARIRRVWLEPSDATPLVEALRAIEAADLVVIGPGSLYTSVIPNLLIAPIAEAVRRTRALRCYVANAMTQPGETAGYTAWDHLQAIEEHAGPRLVDVMLVNGEAVPADVLERYRAEGADAVVPGARGRPGVEMVVAPLLAIEHGVVRHDPDKLARAILRLLLRFRPDWARGRPWESLWLEQRLRADRGDKARAMVPYARS
ncbi:MAG: YvcK family protein [Actinomycetia bacterium]|nr:YvcK family protein [Actinomycetes bacterium]